MVRAGFSWGVGVNFDGNQGLFYTMEGFLHVLGTYF